LVDKVKPGDRIEVSGVFRTEKTNNFSVSVFKTVLVATGIKNILMEREKPIMSESDIKNIKKLSKEKDLFDILGGSIASSIEGHNTVKKAILL
jgi:DNA replication licensing factor MCM3